MTASALPPDFPSDIEYLMLARRQRAGFSLAALIAAGYAALIGTMAFAPEVLAHPAWNGSIITRGLAWAFGYSLLVMAATGACVGWRGRQPAGGMDCNRTTV